MKTSIKFIVIKLCNVTSFSLKIVVKMSNAASKDIEKASVINTRLVKSA